MRKKDKGHTHAGPLRPSGRPPESEPSEDELAGLEAEDAIRAAAAESGGAALAEPAPEAVQRLETRIADLERQVVEWKDRALRTAADMENYRRRAIRERDEAATRGQADVLKRIMEVVDDLARVAHLDPVNTSSEALHEGMLAIERKFQRVLEASGVERIDPAGTPFDPNAHEAVTMMPAPGPEADGTVGAVFQPGYRLHGTLLRPARVAVLKWTAPAPPADLVH